MSFIKVIDLGVKALVFSKFQTIFGISDITRDIVFQPRDIALRKVAEKRAGDRVGFINFWRGDPKFAWDRQRTSAGVRGLHPAYTDSGQTDVVNIRAVPIDLDYSISFWSRELERLTNVEEEYLFWIHENPNLILNYNDVYPVEFDLHFGSILESGTVEDQFEKGTYFVKTFDLKVDGWIFKLSEEKAVHTITVKVYDNTYDPDGILLDTLTIP